MIKTLALFLLTAAPAIAQGIAPDEMPPGLVSARLLPGWITADGARMTALAVELEPGWKTYWRTPGDAGLAPVFDWKGNNIGKVDFSWPAPQVVVSDGVRTLGFHDRLVLPFTVTPEKPGQPVGLSAHVTVGLCENICIPAQLDLVAMPAGTAPDPVIQAALHLPELPQAPAPQVLVTNQVAPAQITVQPAEVTVLDRHPVRAEQVVERDAQDEIVKTITTYHQE